jgi:tetratricopeptide (TPR) repeat protein
VRTFFKRYDPEQKWTLLFLLSCLTAILFSATVGPEFIWDDKFFILNNRFLFSWSDFPKLFVNSIGMGSSGTQSNFYRPVQAITHFFDVQMYGMNPWWHHITNVTLIVGVSAVFFLLFCRLFRTKKETPLAVFLGLSLWVFHPLQSNVVGYLSGRGDLLVCLFMGLAALFWRRTRWLSLLFCLLAILSKENGMLAPFFVFLCDWIEVRREGERWRWKSYVPLFLLMLLYGFARLSILNFQNTLNFYNRENILTSHYDYRLYTYFSTFAKSLQLIFFPFDVHHGRSWVLYTTPFFPWPIAGFCALVFMLATILFCFKRHPRIAVGLTWFLVAGLPTSNLLAVINALFYDHWVLVPSLGFVFLWVLFFQWMLTRFSEKKSVFLWLLLALPLSFITWQENCAWQDQESQYLHILRYEPSNPTILNNLANHYEDIGKMEQAKLFYLRSLEAQETVQGHNNLGWVFLHENNLEAAFRELSRAVQLDPSLYQAQSGLGLVLLSVHQCKEAEDRFAAALKIFPDPAAIAGMKQAKECLHE